MRRTDPSTQLLIDIIVEDILTCDLCSTRMSLFPKMKVPKNLDCSHTFCVNCLEQLKTGMGMFSTILCPKCGVETTLGISGVSGLKNNHTVISVINILEAFNAVTCSLCHVKPATLQCLTCIDTPNICESCNSAQGSPHTFHDIRPIDSHPSNIPTQSPLRPKSFNDEEVIVECPRSIVGKVLSSPRNSFERIRSDTQCSVDVRKLSDRDSPAQITIRGPRDSVRRAQSMVENIMDSVVLNNPNEIDDNEEDHHEEYTIDISFYEAISIFELRYNAIQNISSQTNTDIRLIQHPQDERMRIIVIRPSPNGGHSRTNIARKTILKMIEEINIDRDRDRDKISNRYDNSISDHVGEVSEVVILSNIQFHKLASAGFLPLQRIAQRVGCRIDANEDNQTGVIIIKGSIIQVREAKHLLKHVLDNRPHSFTPSTMSSASVPPGFNVLPNTNSLTPPSKNLIQDNNVNNGISNNNNNNININNPNQMVIMSSTTFGVQDDRKRPQSFTNFPTDMINKEYVKGCPPISPSVSNLRRDTTMSSSSTTSNSSSSTSNSSSSSTTPSIASDRSPVAKSGSNTSNSKIFSFREPKIVSTHINCEYESIGKLIGSRGGRIEELRTLTECQITIKKGDLSNVYCIVEITGTPDKVAYAVPLIKMVLGSGDAVMTTVRSILPNNQLQNQNQNYEIKESTPSTPISSKYIESPTHQVLTSPIPQKLQIIEQLDVNLDTNSQLPGNQSVDSKKLSNSPQPNITSSTSFLSPTSSISHNNNNNNNNNNENKNNENNNGTLINENIEDTYVSSSSDDDDNEDNDENNRSSNSNNNNDSNNDLLKSPQSTSKSSITPTKYNISPPPSPPPSTVFPEYFIQSQSIKLVETISYPIGKFSDAELQEISLFSRCKISTLESTYNRRSDQITLQFQGYPDQRELAKLLVDAIVKPGQFKTPGLTQKEGLDGLVRTMDCPPHFIPVLIGPGGMTIESIQTQSGTKILINENIDEDRPPTLSIIGTNEGVNIAVQLLDRLVMNHRFKYRQNNHLLTHSSRARSLPIMSKTKETMNLPPSSYNGNNDDEYDEFNEEDEYDEETLEEGGRTIMTSSPIMSKSNQKDLNNSNYSPSVGALSMMSKSNSNSHSNTNNNNNNNNNTNNNNTNLNNHINQYQLQYSTRQNSISGLSNISESTLTSSVFEGLDFSRSSSNVSMNSTSNTNSSTPLQLSPVRTPNKSNKDIDNIPKLLELTSQQIQNLPQSGLEDIIFCPMDKVAQVIGKRGSILRELKRLSNCEIIVNQETQQDSPTSPVPVKNQKSKKNDKNLSPTPGTIQSKFSLPSEVDTQSQPIKIIGLNKADIDKAKELIRAVIDVGPVAALGMETIKMDCPFDKVPLVIGIKGMTAKEMMRRTGCKIHVNEIAPEGSSMCSIELTGTTEQIDQATKIITHVLEYGTKALGKRFQRTFQKGDDGNTSYDLSDETNA